MNIVNPSNIINIYIAEYSEHTKGYFTSFYTLCIYFHKFTLWQKLKSFYLGTMLVIDISFTTFQVSLV